MNDGRRTSGPREFGVLWRCRPPGSFQGRYRAGSLAVPILSSALVVSEVKCSSCGLLVFEKETSLDQRDIRCRAVRALAGIPGEGGEPAILTIAIDFMGSDHLEILGHELIAVDGAVDRPATERAVGEVLSAADEGPRAPEIIKGRAGAVGALHEADAGVGAACRRRDGVVVVGGTENDPAVETVLFAKQGAAVRTVVIEGHTVSRDGARGVDPKVAMLDVIQTRIHGHVATVDAVQPIGIIAGVERDIAAGVRQVRGLGIGRQS